MDYFLSGETDSKGVMVLLFPMRVASRHLTRVPSVAVWLGSAMGRLSSDKGWKIGQHILT